MFFCMDNALWISRHAPTEEQIHEINAMGYRIAELECGKAIGAFNINTEDDLNFYWEKLEALCASTEAMAIFGVFPTPVRELFLVRDLPGWWNTPIYESWNVSRPSENGKPSFQHKKFCLTQEV